MFSSSLYRVLFQSFFPQNISLLPKNVTEAHANLKKKKTTATLLWQIMWSFSSTPLGSFENKAIKSEDRSMKHPKTCSVIDIQYVRLQNNQFFSQNQLTGYPWENHAKGATVHITELAQTVHIGITWWSIGRYGISLIKLLSLLFFRGVPLNNQIYTEICSNFVIFLNDNISGKLFSNPGETKFSLTAKYTLSNDDNIISVTLIY